MLAARGMAASAAMQHAACWIQFYGRMVMNHQAGAGQRGCPVGSGCKKNIGLRNYHLMHQFLARVAFLHCQSQGDKAAISEKSWHLLQFNFDLAALRKCFNSHFASSYLPTKERNCGLCSWYESPLGCTVPRSKKMKQKLNLAGSLN